MKIQRIKTVFNGELSELKIKVNSFDIEDNGCTLTWIFYNPEGAEVRSGNYTLTQDEYDNWGSEDNYLYSVICDHFSNDHGIMITLL